MAAAPAPPAAGAQDSTAPAGPPAAIYGFHRDSFARQREIESLIIGLPDAARVEAHARVLTAEPHVAGTPENERVARYIFERFKEQLKLFLPGKFTSSFFSLEVIILPPAKFKILFSKNLC